MMNTGLRLYLFSSYYHWNFWRTIWENADGVRFAKINGVPYPINELINDCEKFDIV